MTTNASAILSISSAPFAPPVLAALGHLAAPSAADLVAGGFAAALLVWTFHQYQRKPLSPRFSRPTHLSMDCPKEPEKSTRKDLAA